MDEGPMVCGVLRGFGKVRYPKKENGQLRPGFTSSILPARVVSLNAQRYYAMTNGHLPLVDYLRHRHRS